MPEYDRNYSEERYESLGGKKYLRKRIDATGICWKMNIFQTVMRCMRAT